MKHLSPVKWCAPQSGITLTARAGTEGAVSVSGPDADMTALTGKLAEAVYRLTQPYRYAIYLMRHENRPAEAAPIFGELALHGSPEERRWSYNMWANATEIATHDYDLGLRMYRKAHEADPDAIQPISTLGQDLSRFGRIEESLQIQKEGLAISGRTTRLPGSPTSPTIPTIWLGRQTGFATACAAFQSLSLLAYWLRPKRTCINSLPPEPIWRNFPLTLTWTR